MTEFLKNPEDIASWRLKAFEIREALVMKRAQFDELLPFIDNHWVETNKSRPNRRERVFRCRLAKGPAKKSQGKEIRKKLIRDHPACGMRLKVSLSEEEDIVILSRGTARGEPDCTKHNHSIELVDRIKINTHVRDAATSLVSHNFAPS